VDLYFEYIKERENLDHVLGDDYFFTYEIRDNEFYLANIYLRPSKRGTPSTFEMYQKMESIALENSCNLISANIYLTDSGFHRTLKSALKLGFSIVMAQNNCVTIVRKLGA
jgi:hypothetical protein